MSFPLKPPKSITGSPDCSISSAPPDKALEVVQRYANDLVDYHKKYKATQDEYFDEYKATRDELTQKDQGQKNTAVASAKLKLDEAMSILNSAKQAVDEYEIFSEQLKNTQDIATIIDYFKDGRADTIKEAVNLFYDEKLKYEEYQRNEDHRKKMEQLAQEQTRAMQEAANASATAVNTSEEAKSIAREAKSIAREAINIAEEVKSMVENH